MAFIRQAMIFSLSLVAVANRTDDGQPWVLPVVRTIDAQMSADLTLNHEYLPLTGLKSFCDASTRLLLGEGSSAITQNRVSMMSASTAVLTMSVCPCVCVAMCVFIGVWSAVHLWHWFNPTWI